MSPRSARPAELVDWALAERVARRALSLTPSFDQATLRAAREDFIEVTARAEQLVTEVTGLHTNAGPVHAVVTDRAGWVHANLGSFSRLLRPLTDRLLEDAPKAVRSGASQQAAAVEVGLLLAWISSRILGQYDLFPPDDPDGADALDAVYYVAPNIVGIERQHGFSAKEFRLWIAVHEVTHRLQFTGVPWMRGHFLDLVDRGTSLRPPDAHTVLESLRRAAREIQAGRNPLADGGVVGLLASSEQLETLREAQALMSLLEGHGDVVMDTVGATEIPGSERFSAVLAERRAHTKGASKLIQQVLGIEAKIRQYRDGERFVNDVIAEGGDELFRRCWDGPEMLPSIEEIRDPALWVARVGARSSA